MDPGVKQADEKAGGGGEGREGGWGMGRVEGRGALFCGKAP